MKMQRTLALALVACGASAAFAQITMDGQRDAAYGAALAVQNNETGFGDSNLGLVGPANGSELDNLHVRRTATDLYLYIGGNLEGGPTTFNKIAIFVDSQAGGYNRLPTDLPDIDFNRFIRFGDDGSGNGLKFDSGFEADHFLGLVCGGDPAALYLNYSEVKKVADGGVAYYMGTANPGSDGTLSGGNNPFNAQYTLNNSNVAGVPGGIGVDPGNGAPVATGMEVKIPLAQIGAGSGDIRLTIFVFNDGFDFLSNQFLPGLGGADNLGEPRLVDLELVAGNQFVTVPGSAPEVVVPSSFATVLGRLDAGDVASLSADDDNYLRHCKFIVPNALVAPVRVRVNGTTTKTSTTGIAAACKGKMQSGGSFSLGVEQRNFVSGVNQDLATGAVGTSEVTVTSNTTGTHSEMIGTAGALQAEYLVRQTGPSVVSLWCFNADHFTWTVN